MLKKEEEEEKKNTNCSISLKWSAFYLKQNFYLLQDSLLSDAVREALKFYWRGGKMALLRLLVQLLLIQESYRQFY